jgi:hypothetical protein
MRAGLSGRDGNPTPGTNILGQIRLLPRDIGRLKAASWAAKRFPFFVGAQSGDTEPRQTRQFRQTQWGTARPASISWNRAQSKGHSASTAGSKAAAASEAFQPRV